MSEIEKLNILIEHYESVLIELKERKAHLEHCKKISSEILDTINEITDNFKLNYISNRCNPLIIE